MGNAERQPKVILKRTEVADYVIGQSADFFGVPKKTLLCNYNHNGKYRTQMVIKVMYDKLDFRFKEISDFLHYCGHPPAIYRLYRRISDDIEGVNGAKHTYNQLLTYLNL